MNAKRVFSIAAVIFILAALFNAAPAKAAAAPPVTAKVAARSIPLNLGNGKTGVCEIRADGSRICYEYVDPLYTDPTYSCPEGSEPVNGDAKNGCIATSTETIYTDRPQVPTTYKCPDDSWTGPNADGICTKLVTPGYWTCNVGDTGPDANGLCTPPATLSCPGPFTFTDQRYTCPNGYKLEGTMCTKNNQPSVPATLETVGPLSVNYGLKSNDPNHCHLDTGVKDQVPSWAMSDFNGQFGELEDIISTPGTPYQGTWHAPVYDSTPQVVDVAAHPGACPAGWNIFSDTQCSKDVTEDQAIDPIVTPGTPYCKEGDLVNGQCKVEIPCPPIPCEWNPNIPADDPLCVPPPPKGCPDGQRMDSDGVCFKPRSCPVYIAWLQSFGIYDRLPPRCQKSGVDDVFQTIGTWVNSWWPW